METLLQQYAGLDFQSKEIESRKFALKLEIMKQMKDQKKDKVESIYAGKFIIAYRKIWTYTKKVIQMEEKLKLAKIKEEQRGKAKSQVTEYLMFSPLND